MTRSIIDKIKECVGLAWFPINLGNPQNQAVPSVEIDTSNLSLDEKGGF